MHQMHHSLMEFKVFYLLRLVLFCLCHSGFPMMYTRRKSNNRNRRMFVCTSSSCGVRLFWFRDQDSGGPGIGTRWRNPVCNVEDRNLPARLHNTRQTTNNKNKYIIHVAYVWWVNYAFDTVPAVEHTKKKKVGRTGKKERARASSNSGRHGVFSKLRPGKKEARSMDATQ